jgi:sugar phosphate isomerase/epimerase
MSVSRRKFFAAAGALTAAAATSDSLVSAADNSAATPTAAGAPLKFALGLVTYNVGAKWDLPTLLKVLKTVGIGSTELRTGHAHGVEPTISKEQRQEVKKQFADAGVQLWGCGSTCEFHAPDQAVVEKNIELCKQFVQLVSDLGGKGVKVRPNGIPKNIPVEKTLEQIGKALIPCGKAAADAGLEIWVEVHGAGSQHPPYIKTIMETCGLPNVGCTWNSNPTDIVNGSVSEYFHLLRPWIKSCHIHDLYDDGNKQVLKGYPYRELFRLMRETGYDRVTECEISRTPPDAASGEEILKYYKALWTELAKA